MNLFILTMALLLAIALACWAPYLRNARKNRFGWRDFWASELGTVVVTYLFPVGTVATTIPPTQTAMASHNLLVAQVFMDTSDTVATVTHNMNLSTVATLPAPSTAFNMPEVVPVPNQQGSAPVPVAVSGYAANTIGLSKGNAANSSVTLTVYIKRPFSPGL